MADGRVQRLVFGEVAEEYDRHRPTYPDELFTLLADRADPDEVLDIGSGTGRVATALAVRGLPGHAVEPDASMVAVARDRLPDTWTVEISDFEDCDARGRADWPLITCGQAWHWIDDRRGFARAAGLLAPGAPLALFWNRPTFVQDELRQELDEIYDRLAPAMESSLRGRGAAPKGELRDVDIEHPATGFGAVEEHQLHWQRTYTRVEWIALLGTHSDHRLLDPELRDELHVAVGEAIDRHGGAFVLPYRVDVTLFFRA